MSGCIAQKNGQRAFGKQFMIEPLPRRFGNCAISKCSRRFMQHWLSIGVMPVFLKGTALAYACYPDPTLRARADTDIIIQSSERRRVHDVLTTLGFELSTGISGEFVSYQANYKLTAADKGTHSIDLHWRVNNSELLSRLFSYDELLKNAIRSIQVVSCTHWALARFMLCSSRACIAARIRQNPYYSNGVANYGADRLIWLYDIHLLVESLSRSEWDCVFRLAVAKGLCATCLDGIGRARACFDTRCPDFVLAGLSVSGDKELPTTYLNGSKLRQQWMDFRALGEFSSKLRFLKECLLPPAAYMRSKYLQSQHDWLPVLYIRRAIDGLAKRLKTRETT